jgi:hypothetical protein
MFKSDMGNEFFGKKGENPSEEKPKEKPSEQSEPKPKPKPIHFHCEYFRRDGQRMCFASRRSERRKWLMSGLTRTCTTLLMVYLSLVCICPGQRPLSLHFRLGEIEEFQVVLLAEHHRLD